MFEAEKKGKKNKRRTRGGDSITSISSITSVVSVISVRSRSRTRRPASVREEGSGTSSETDRGTDEGPSREVCTTVERIEVVETVEKRDTQERRSVSAVIGRRRGGRGRAGESTWWLGHVRARASDTGAKAGSQALTPDTPIQLPHLLSRALLANSTCPRGDGAYGQRSGTVYPRAGDR